MNKKIPEEFLYFYYYVRCLWFKEKPNYDYLKDLLKDLAIKNNIDLVSQLFDWNLKITLIKNQPQLTY